MKFYSDWKREKIKARIKDIEPALKSIMANLLVRYLQRNARQEPMDSFEGNETPR
jgi:hypothetical protein